MNNLSIRTWGLDSRKYNNKARLLGLGLGFFYFLLAFMAFAVIDMVRWIDYLQHEAMPTDNPHHLLAGIYLFLVIGGLVLAQFYRHKKSMGNLYTVTICMSVFFGNLLAALVEFAIQMYFAVQYTQQTGYTFSNYLTHYWSYFWFEYAVVLSIFSIVLTVRWRMRVYKLNVQRDTQDTSKRLGAAQIASEKDITDYGLRRSIGMLMGKDKVGYLRLDALTDHLILGYRGNGKTSTKLIPFILDYMHINKLLTDIKGELVAVTAKKALAAGRTVYILDPFEVLAKLGVIIQTHKINPFIYVNTEDPLEMDRYLSALASVLCNNDFVPQTETEMHFKENAQIIIEGILDHYFEIFKEQPNKLNLVELHDWWLSVVLDETNTVIESMKKSTIKAKASAAQLTTAGKDEAGSMKTTVYRQLQWLRSANIRNTFSDNTLDIDKFISGQCDVYVVLPEDMVSAYSRMMRFVMAIIKVKIIQAAPQTLQDHYYFVLDELGQFGYCPDVEVVINTLRSRGVKILAAFQTIAQIEKYKDEAVFKSMPVKHFFRNDDLKTLEWIQKLADKTTVLTENVSRNISSASTGGKGTVSESHSISETAAHLIHFSDIREMPNDDQYIFMHGKRVIRCQKAYYYNEPIYEGRYDANPLET